MRIAVQTEKKPDALSVLVEIVGKRGRLGLGEWMRANVRLVTSGIARHILPAPVWQHIAIDVDADAARH